MQTIPSEINEVITAMNKIVNKLDGIVKRSNNPRAMKYLELSKEYSELAIMAMK